MNIEAFVRAVSIVAAVAFGSVHCHCALAQNFPSRSIKIVVPGGPAGSPDILARAIGEKMSENWGQPVVVENRPGANGIVASEVVAKAAPDGYTLLMAYDAHSTNPSMYTLPYNTVKDFTPISMIATIPRVMIVPASLGVSTVSEFIALAKSRPGELNYASVGKGSSSHLAVELFKTITGVKLVHVPYKDNNAVLMDLITGRVHMGMFSLVSMLPVIRDGRVRALAVSLPQRSPDLPDVPTMVESGLGAYDYAPWIGLIAPANTPKEIVAKLNAEIARIVALPEVQKRYSTELTLSASTPEKFAATIEADIDRWAKVPKGD